MGRTSDFLQKWHHVMNDLAWDKVNDTKWRNNVASGHQRQRSGSHDLGGAKHTRCTRQTNNCTRKPPEKIEVERSQKCPRPAGLAPI